MSTSRLHVLNHGALHPTANMAWDEALLDVPGPPILRTYRWAPTGLSLGWFQPHAPFRAFKGSHHIVRRRTGGGAIYHQHEWTFALIVPCAMLPKATADAYRAIHRALATTLKDAGVPCEFPSVAEKPGDRTRHARGRELWCFNDVSPFDLVAPDGTKLVGSAQRRVVRDGTACVLHHGSLALRHPKYPKQTAAVEDHADPDGVVDQLSVEFPSALATTLKTTVEPRHGEPNDQQRERQSALEHGHRTGAQVLRR